jgi:hypothetical protein
LDDSQLSDDEQAAFGALAGGLDGCSAWRRQVATGKQVASVVAAFAGLR